MQRFNFITKIVWACVILLSTIQCKHIENAKTEKVEMYLTGEVKTRFYTVDGKKEGIMTDYYKNGKVRAEKNFKDDRQHGKTTVWFESGKLKEVQYFDFDKRILNDTIYHENGQIYMIIPYVQNVKNGLYTLYDSLGNVLYKSVYKNDRLISPDSILQK
jgi:antitoxin component YwqK of YwqJK toxin-antitoxin module